MFVPPWCLGLEHERMSVIVQGKRANVSAQYEEYGGAQEWTFERILDLIRHPQICDHALAVRCEFRWGFNLSLGLLDASYLMFSSAFKN